MIRKKNYYEWKKEKSHFNEAIIKRILLEISSLERIVSFGVEREWNSLLQKKLEKIDWKDKLINDNDWAREQRISKKKRMESFKIKALIDYHDQICPFTESITPLDWKKFRIIFACSKSFPLSRFLHLTLFNLLLSIRYSIGNFETYNLSINAHLSSLFLHRTEKKIRIFSWENGHRDFEQRRRMI